MKNQDIWARQNRVQAGQNTDTWDGQNLGIRDQQNPGGWDRWNPGIWVGLGRAWASRM